MVTDSLNSLEYSKPRAAFLAAQFRFHPSVDVNCSTIYSMSGGIYSVSGGIYSMSGGIYSVNGGIYSMSGGIYSVSGGIHGVNTPQKLKFQIN